MTDPFSSDQPPSSPPLQGERVSFTGTLASMTHRQAAELVQQHGGSATAHLSQQTTMLVVGEEGWPLEADGEPSLKAQQAAAWSQQGHPIRVLRETEWLRLLGIDDGQQSCHQLYTPAVLSQLLNVPVNVIRAWERAGLIHAVRKVYRLPYFDFQEVSSARRLSELVAAGVPVRNIARSLERLRTVIGEVQQPLLQLEILARDRRMLYRDARGLLEPATGQRLLEFDPPEPHPPDSDPPAIPFSPPETEDQRLKWKSDDWLREGCRLSAENELSPAVDAFRLALMDNPGDPETNFCLADALYRQGNIVAAIERYYSAVEGDHEFIEAWTQLGCVLAQTGAHDEALQAFDIALEVHPDYPEAHVHKASLLEELGRPDAAAVHWRRYLEFDQRGPWAENARRQLAELGDPEAPPLNRFEADQ